jgi:hypothetical protein
MGDGSRSRLVHKPQYLTTADGLADGATSESKLAAADAATEARLEWRRTRKRGCAGLQVVTGWRRVGKRGASGAQGCAGLAARRKVRGWRRAKKLRVCTVGEKRCVGAKAKTPPFARGLRRSGWSDRDKAGRDTLRSIRHFDEGLRRRLPAVRPRSVLRPTCDLAHCNGPRVAASVLRA